MDDPHLHTCFESFGEVWPVAALYKDDELATKQSTQKDKHEKGDLE